MELPKNYFHDKLVLLILTVNCLLALLTIIMVLLRFDPSRTTGYFTQYRSNLGLNAFTTGSYWQILSFAVFAIFVTAFHVWISMRIYPVRRQLAVTLLAFGTLFLVLGLVISNALLVLA